MTKIKPQLFQAPWAAPANVHTIITSAEHNFNLALHVAADPTTVQAHRAYLQQLLPSPARWLNQTHSCEVIDWDTQAYSQQLNADASITTAKNQVCVVMTADCLPILLSNQTGEFVAAIHAGWRGLNDGILQQTLNKLKQFKTSEMLAFIGPAICQLCFEVGGEVRESFLQNNPATAKHFLASRESGKYLANLRAIAEDQLLQLGFSKSKISNNNICTKCISSKCIWYKGKPQWFYSYRGDPNCGRLASLIWLE